MTTLSLVSVGEMKRETRLCCREMCGEAFTAGGGRFSQKFTVISRERKSGGSCLERLNETREVNQVFPIMARRSTKKNARSREMTSYGTNVYPGGL